MKEEVRREKGEGKRQKVEGIASLPRNDKKQIGFVCVQRNGVSQYRGALCRAGMDRFVCGYGPQAFKERTVKEIIGDLDFTQRFHMPQTTIDILNRVAAPFHRFGVREVDGVKWWGWWIHEGHEEEKRFNAEARRLEGVAV